MKTYPKYLIKLDVSDTPAFLRAVALALSNGWSRCRDLPTTFDGEYFVFQRDRPPHPLRLFVARDDAETLSVINIVPRHGSLTVPEYRAVLLDFQTCVLDKVLQSGFDITLLLGSGDLSIQRLMHRAAFDQLHRFATLANKQTGSLHPSDRDQWIGFLLGYHRSHGDGLAPQHLGAWLGEQRFSPNAIFNLQHEFDFGLALLEHYDEYLRYLAQKSASNS